MTGKYEFEPFTQEEIEILRRFLSYGGFLLVDDALGQQGYGFDKALRTRDETDFTQQRIQTAAFRSRSAPKLLSDAAHRRRAYGQSQPRSNHHRQHDAGHLLPK